jgi:hypothetical protein
LHSLSAPSSLQFRGYADGSCHTRPHVRDILVSMNNMELQSFQPPIKADLQKLNRLVIHWPAMFFLKK